MKTKLLALMLLAGGSMFAQTRFSQAGNAHADERGFRAPTTDRHEVAGRNSQRNDNDRDDVEHRRTGRFDRDNIRGYTQHYRQDSRDGTRFDWR
jgi:hypothetical protein